MPGTGKPKLREIFSRAAECRGAEELIAYLDQACLGDAELRAQLEELLEAHREAGSFLQEPSAAVSETIELVKATEQIGAVIGPYKLVEQIGEGGMGTVWMAQQTEPVKRLVALKLIKSGMDTRQVIARFEAERQALALMDHPNIAKVLDGGTTEAGRPYFVMDLVKGVPITRYCDEHRLTPRQRLELLVPVCQAIQHAHQKGIIHRDLKPSNVLVALYDGRPVPKVIDFGVAKAAGQQLTEKTLVTGFGNIVGTLEYMSPEQVEINKLDIDTRTDIYSLGVMLYELLTGSPPFTRKELEQAGMLEMLRVIREREPSKPSTKLSTAEGLPVLAARRGTEPAKLTKLMRGELDWIAMKALEKDRNRRYDTANGFAQDLQRYLADEPVQAGPPSATYRLRKFVRRNKGKLAAAVMTGLALLVVVSAIGWVIRDRVARQDEAQRERADRRAKVAGQVQLILDEVARLEREQKWPEALDAAQRASDLVAGSEVDVEIAGRVRNAMDDLELVRQLEEIRSSLDYWKGTTFDYGGTAERFEVAFRNAGIDVARLAPEEAARRLQSRPAVLPALVIGLDDWASCRRATDDEPLARSVWKVAGLVDPDPWRQKMRQARVDEDVDRLQALAESPDLARQPPATLFRLGIVLRRMDRVDVAVKVLSVAQRQYPDSFWIQLEFGCALQSQEPPGLGQAEGCYRAALALRPQSTASWNNLGLVLSKQKKLAEAASCFQRVIELDPKHMFAHINLGTIRHDQGNFVDAVHCFEKSIQLDPNYPVAHYNLGHIWADQGKLEKAFQCYQRAIALDPNYAQAHNNFGTLYLRMGKLDDAVASYQKAIDLNPKNPIFYTNLGDVLSALRHFDDAANAFRRAIELEPKNAARHLKLGGVLASQNNLNDAIACYRMAIELDPGSGNAHFLLGNALARQSRYDDAAVSYRRAIALDPKHVMAHERLGAILCDRKKDYDGAIAAFRKVLALEPDRASGHYNLGVALTGRGDTQGAIACFRNSLRLNSSHAQSHINLAQLLSNSPDPRLRNAQEALEAARKGAELAPTSVEALLALGFAQYRSGDWKASIEALEKPMAMQSNPKGGSARQFFLAMAHWQTGAKNEARRWYDEAVAWMEENSPTDRELRRIRAEAEELLGIKKQ